MAVFLQGDGDGAYLSTALPYHSVSRHIEYAYHDWGIAQIAMAAGDEETASRYRRRSHGLWNLWRPETCSFAPRNPDGSWVEHDPWQRWGMPWYYEGGGIAWSFCGLHDVPGLIERCGGAEAFVAISIATSTPAAHDQGDADARAASLYLRRSA